MPGAVGETLRVEGLRELQRAFDLADKELKKEFRDRLKDAAEPVARDAESLARSSIRRMHRSPEWAEMRIGVTATSVYVAPVKRGVKTRRLTVRKSGLAGLLGGTTTLLGPRRPNLADLLMGRSMLPALDRNVGQIEHEVDDLLGEIGRDWERV